MTRQSISHEELTRLLDYDSKTGLFTRKVTTYSRWKKGTVCNALCKETGYIKIHLNRKIYFAHRLAWFYVYKKWPDYQIDHINGDRVDNRIENLRDIEQYKNCQNVISSTNTSGYQGVSWRKDRNRWTAQISINNVTKRVGTFKLKEDAYKAYLEAKEKYHKYFNAERLG